MLACIAHLLEISASQNMETGSRFGGAQSTARAHSVRERGDLQSVKEALVEGNMGPIEQVRLRPAD